jgi:hypothetical protein
VFKFSPFEKKTQSFQMSRELAADPIQMSDDDDDATLFAIRRSTRDKSSKKPTTPIAVSVNKRLLQSAQSKNQKQQPMRKNPVSFEIDVNENDDDDDEAQWQGRTKRDKKAPPVVVETPVKSAKTKKNSSANGSDSAGGRSGARAGGESSGSATTSRRRALKTVIEPDADDDDDDSNSDGVLHNPTSRRPLQSRGAKKSLSPEEVKKKRVASSLFDDSPVTGKRHAATVAASAVAAAIDDNDDSSGPLQVTAKVTVDDSDDSDDFQSARERRESSGGGSSKKSSRAKPSPKDNDKITRHKRAVELKKKNPDIAKARVTEEDDWLAGSLASMLSNAPAHKADEPLSSPAAAAVAQKTPAVAHKASAKFLDNDADSSPSQSQAIVSSPVAAREHVPMVPQTTSSAPPPPFLPEHCNGINVNALLKEGACLVTIDGILSGATKSARMDAFEQGGRARRDLSQTIATGYFSTANVNTLLDALQKRYVTEANIERFSGNLNVMRVIGDVLLSELVVELMRLACGETITREKALYYVEHPIITDADRAKAIAEARGSRSRIRR